MLRSFRRFSWGNRWIPTKTVQQSNLSVNRYDVGSTSTTSELDLSENQVFTVTADTNRTLVFNNPPSQGRSMTIVVRVIGNAGAIIWPSGIQWAGNEAPLLDTNWTMVILTWVGDSWIGLSGASQ